MLRHIFYALLGGYFVAGLLIGLNWLGAVDLGREGTAVQEPVFAPDQGNRTLGAESADVTDLRLGQALSSQDKSSGNGRLTISPPPVAGLPLPHPDGRAAKGPESDTGPLEMRRPQPSAQSLKAPQVDRGSLPKARSVNQSSTPHQRMDQPNSTSIPQTFQPAQVDTGARAMVALSRARQGRRLLEARRKPVELVNLSAQVDTGALATVTAPPRAQQGRRLLEARRKPVELNVSAPFFGGSAEPAPMKLGVEIDRKSSADSDSIPPKAIRKVFTLACSLLRPAIAAGKLSPGKGIEIGRMQDDYLKRAECLGAAKRATTIAKRNIGCRCTAETKELDAAAHVPLAPNSPVPMPKPRYRR
jgi:hypothetical protein